MRTPKSLQINKKEPIEMPYRKGLDFNRFFTFLNIFKKIKFLGYFIYTNACTISIVDQIIPAIVTVADAIKQALFLRFNFAH